MAESSPRSKPGPGQAVAGEANQDEPGFPLSRLVVGKKARVVEIRGGLGIKRRLNHMGIHPGDLVTVIRHGALGGPIAIGVHGFHLALGRGVASQIFVEEVAE